jgi:hypothetical protein
MAVLLTNASLGVRRRGTTTTDSHGMPVGGAYGALQGPWPGLVTEQADGAWRLGLDPAAWPVRAHDLVVESGGAARQWLVLTAELLQNVAADAAGRVDWVRVTAQERVTGGTEPGGPEFAGRQGL